MDVAIGPLRFLNQVPNDRFRPKTDIRLDRIFGSSLTLLRWKLMFVNLLVKRHIDQF